MRHPAKCATCQLGKQHHRHAPGKLAKMDHQSEGILKQDILFPGIRVSVDHLWVPLLADTSIPMARTATSFVAAEPLWTIALDISRTSSSPSSKSKHTAMCSDHCVILQDYDASDNGSTFNCTGFGQQLAKFAQILSFTGVGPHPHHHNGVAKCSIFTIMSMARCMMLHAAIHWPEMANCSLWPMAVVYAIFIYNHVPSLTTGLSPNNLFTKTKWPFHKLNFIILRMMQLGGHG